MREECQTVGIRIGDALRVSRDATGLPGRRRTFSARSTELDIRVSTRVDSGKWNLGRSMSKMLLEYLGDESPLDEQAVIQHLTLELMQKYRVSRRFTEHARRRNSFAEGIAVCFDNAPACLKHLSVPGKHTSPHALASASMPLRRRTLHDEAQRTCHNERLPMCSFDHLPGRGSFGRARELSTLRMNTRGDVPDTGGLLNSDDTFQKSAVALFDHLAEAESFLVPRQALRKPGCDANIYRRGSSYSALTTSSLAQSHDNLALGAPNIRTVVMHVLEMSTNGEINMARDNAGDTLLHAATRKGFVDVVRVLLNNSANVEATNNSGDTALHVACGMSGCKSVGSEKDAHYPLKIVQFLVGDGADVCVVNSARNSPLHLAEDTLTVKYLLDHGADAEERNFAKETPLFTAVRRGNVGSVKLLLDLSDNVSRWTNVDRQTPLHIAAENGGRQIVVLLLQADAQVDRIDSEGRTALHVAAQLGHQDVAEVLLQAKADVDALDEHGRSPLIIATIANRKQMVASLIKHGANVRATWNDHTALDLAIEDEQTVIPGLLLEASRMKSCVSTNSFLNNSAQGSPRSCLSRVISTASFMPSLLRIRGKHASVSNGNDFIAREPRTHSIKVELSASTSLLRVPRGWSNDSSIELERRKQHVTVSPQIFFGRTL